MKLGGESHIYSPPKVGQTALSAATFPDSCRAHRRQVSRVMAWRQVATGVTPLPHQLRLQDSAEFGSKFGYLSRKAPRVRCPRFRGQRGKLRRGTPNFSHLCPFVPILACSCPLMVWNRLGICGLLALHSGKIFSFGPLAVPNALMRVTTNRV